MTAATINREKRKAAKMAADTQLTAILDAYSADYQRGLAAVRAGEMSGAQFQQAVRAAGRVRDAKLSARRTAQAA